MIQSDLFSIQPTWPDGLRYSENAISAAEEVELVERFRTLPFRPFEFHGYLGFRRIVSYGWSYDYAGRAVRRSDPLPSWLAPLRSRAACLAGLEAESLQQALVTEYTPGAGIGWHRDKAVFGDVVAFSFLSPCPLRFRRKSNGGWERTTVDVQRRSAYLLRGEARTAWEHSIAPVSTLRHSVTLRTMAHNPDKTS